MKRGFTLSEVLITLGIVGVVAVLTVPSVMKNYRNRMYVAQLQKVYAQISEATQAIMRDENVDNILETSLIFEQGNAGIDENTGKGTSWYMKFLTNYFKVNKYNCADSNFTSPCVPVERDSDDVYRSISGVSLGGLSGNYCVQTTNGASICMISLGGPGNPGNSYIYFIVDVNGISGPNIAGRDLFMMSAKEDGSVVDGFVSADLDIPSVSASDCNSDTTSIETASSGCLNAIIDAGWKMEY